MQKRSGLIVIFTLLFLSVQAQQTLNFPEVDKKSYDLYMNGNWKELIQYADEARQQGIDFFYLQARTGIAYYNLKRYRTAGRWFRKAWENDHSFEWLQEYMYYSLLFGGRESEAYKIAGNFSPALQEKIGFSSNGVTRAGVEIGYTFNSDLNALKRLNHGQLVNVGENYGEAFYLKNYHFESFDLSHRLAPWVSINHNFTYIGIMRDQIVDWSGRNSFPAKTSQYQYFLNPHAVIGNKWNISPSLSYIWGSYAYRYGAISGNRRFFGNAEISYNDFVFSMATWAHYGNFAPGAELNLANISNEPFRQYSGWITIYPFSNLSLYITPRIYLKHKQDQDIGYNAFGVSGGIQLGPVHFYGNYLNGEMENFIESAGYVVSNFPGISKEKFSGSIYFPTGKSYRFVFRYLTQDVTESYQVYTNYIKTDRLEYNYGKHTLTGGIIWSF